MSLPREHEVYVYDKKNSLQDLIDCGKKGTLLAKNFNLKLSVY